MPRGALIGLPSHDISYWLTPRHKNNLRHASLRCPPLRSPDGPSEPATTVDEGESASESATTVDEGDSVYKKRPINWTDRRDLRQADALMGRFRVVLSGCPYAI